MKIRKTIHSLREDKKGDAMIVVLVVMTILVVLSLTILLSASTLLGSARKNVIHERLRTMIVSFNETITREVVSDEETEIKTYIKTEITSKAWKNDEDRSLKITNGLTSMEDLTEGYTVDVKMKWSGDDYQNYQELEDYAGIKLFITMTAKKDEEQYIIKTSYIMRYDNEDATWRWEKEESR